MPRIELVIITATIEDETEVAQYYASAEARVQAGSERHRVPLFVDHRHVAGVAGMLCSSSRVPKSERSTIRRVTFIMSL